jgi:hypothetical protein
MLEAGSDHRAIQWQPLQSHRKSSGEWWSMHPERDPWSGRHCTALGVSWCVLWSSWYAVVALWQENQWSNEFSSCAFISYIGGMAGQSPTHHSRIVPRFCVWLLWVGGHGICDFGYLKKHPRPPIATSVGIAFLILGKWRSCICSKCIYVFLAHLVNIQQYLINI